MQNHITITKAGVCNTGDYYMLSDTFTETRKPPYIYKNVNPGLYLFNYKKRCFIIHLPYALSGDDQLSIEGRIAHTIINTKIRRLIAYEVSPSMIPDGIQFILQKKFSYPKVTNKYTASNTIAGYLDILTASGLTIVSGNKPSPDNPIDITSISSFNVITKNNKEQSITTINLNNNLKSLPSGISDTFIMDSTKKVSYIINRIGRLVLTGNESWSKIEENDKYCIYFYKFNGAKEGTDANSIICNYFPSMIYSNMIDNKIDTCGICVSNDPFKTGFFVRVPTKTITERGVDHFKEYLRSLMNNKKPVIIEYQLNTVKYKSIILDTYDIKQYYPKTLISIDNPNIKAGYFFSTLYYYEEEQK
jgi:hypothetical protein